jgi:hypothetical protein
MFDSELVPMMRNLGLDSLEDDVTALLKENLEWPASSRELDSGGSIQRRMDC